MDATGLSLDERDLEVAATMADYVAAFARHGDPNAPGRPRWSAFGTSELLLSVEPDRIGTRPDQRSRRLDLIEGMATRLGY
jgi:para-nitrobenzyl esterase